MTSLSVHEIKADVAMGRIAAKYHGKSVLIEHDELAAYIASLPSDPAERY